jgi:hypothetical protein
MTNVTKPTKEAVRKYMQDQRGRCPPDPAEIRRQLGWYIIAPIAQGIEHQPSKLRVAGLNPAGRTNNVPVAQSVRAGAS